ncbi:MAG: hypothetical protein GX921_06075, partial [Bacteroidales bacterium]|nr:hypothetical protein [Bacteroidales bacterium]
MRNKTLLYIVTVISLLAFSCNSSDKTPSQLGHFNAEKDLLLVQLDCKTDVDDLQTAAGLATLMSNSEFSEINYHVVTGAYGIQGGLYLSPNSLLELAFKNNWTDAHENFESAIEQVKLFVEATLENEGDIWIAEAG